MCHQLSFVHFPFPLVDKPGKELYIADTLSRAYLKEKAEQLLEDELQVHLLTAQLPITADEELQMVIDMVQAGWPAEIRHVPADIRKYWTFREELTCFGGLLFKNMRLVIPSSLKADMIARVHEAHLVKKGRETSCSGSTWLR